MEYQDRLFNQKNRASMDKIINNLPGGIIVFEMQENKIKTLFSTELISYLDIVKKLLKRFSIVMFLKLFINLI